VDRTASILLVDDDATVVDVVERYLRREGFDVATESDGDRALAQAISDPPDLMVLDLMLPGMHGLEVCRRLRALAPVPVIMLTARGDESDRLIGLELGADDYVAKPFSPKELTARVKAVLRRASGPLAVTGPSSAVLRSEGIVLDLAGRDARVDGDLVALTAREFELLAFLMRHAGRVFRREELLQHVWGFSTGDTSTVTVHVRRLREKVERDPADPRRLTTVWGVGYRFDGEIEDDLAGPDGGAGAGGGVGAPGAGAPTERGANG
jgi:DNA-binding response OmpR family regulator